MGAHRCFALAALTLCIVSLAQAAGPPLAKFADLEPGNNATAGADVISFELAGRAQMAIGSLAPGDVDYFRLFVPANYSLQVVTTPLEDVPNSLALPDTVVELRDINDNTLLVDDDAGSDFPPTPPSLFQGSVLRYDAAADITLYIRVRGFGNDQAGRYALTVGLIFGTGGDWTESASNQSTADADIFERGISGPLVGAASISISTQRDYTGFDLNVGDVVTVSTSPTTTIWTVPDTNLTIFGPDSAILVSSNDDSSGAFPSVTVRGSTVRFRAETTGRYYARVTGFGGSTGFYRLLTSVVPAAQCTGDANGDGFVSFPDVISVLANWSLLCP